MFPINNTDFSQTSPGLTSSSPGFSLFSTSAIARSHKVSLVGRKQSKRIIREKTHLRPQFLKTSKLRLLWCRLLLFHITCSLLVEVLLTKPAEVTFLHNPTSHLWHILSTYQLYCGRLFWTKSDWKRPLRSSSQRVTEHHQVQW